MSQSNCHINYFVVHGLLKLLKAFVNLLIFNLWHVCVAIHIKSPAEQVAVRVERTRVVPARVDGQDVAVELVVKQDVHVVFLGGVVVQLRDFGLLVPVIAPAHGLPAHQPTRMSATRGQHPLLVQQGSIHML